VRKPALSAGQIALWTTLGAAAGLLAGFALGEWMGGINAGRLRRAARRIQREPTAGTLGPAASARAAGAALAGESGLHGFGLEARPLSRGAVELRGWVPSRAARALAARVVRAVPGIDSVINNILVRGEDDRALALQATDQPA
jgi:hypothetical protein